MTIFELHIFGLTIAPSYYGLMYVLAFVACYFTVKKSLNIDNSKMDDLFLYTFLGVIIGGRLFYTLFYDLSYYINNPTHLIKIWEGGMSFHGGAAGVIIAMYFFSKKYSISYLKLADQICRSLPIGLFLGRIGNLINKELLGYEGYNGIFAVLKGGKSYFPSPLLEAFLEGIVMLFILNLIYYKYKKFDGQVATLFLVLYAIFRIFVEVFFRQPDSQIGYIFGFFTMGELLTIPMFLVGIYLYNRFRKNV